LSTLRPGKWYTIGAAADCDIVLEAAQVSGHHARIAASARGYIVEDNGSSNGLWFQGYRVPSVEVVDGDVLSFGTFQVGVGALVARLATPRAEPPRPKSTAPGGPLTVPGLGPSPERPVRDVEVGDRVLVIGRDMDCDVPVSEGAVSGRHARVFRNAGRIILDDLGSRNGTHVRVGGEGDWVSYRSCVLRRQDVVRIGSQCFRFHLARTERRAGARVDVQSLSLTVRHRATGAPMNLLNDVSFTALDGEVVGILGPSGSGKTSLLNVMAGFDAPTSGRVLVQGQPVHDGAELAAGLGSIIGHAPQFDVAHELLTVEEVIAYSARLRGDATWSEAEIARRVSDAIVAVGLESKRTTPLGSETRKTLSGGQKKRVNIAMELVLDPPVLLLDEPTSGLSAHDSMDLMALLRRLADQGRTVVLTIHQPSYAAYVQMDQVLLLEEGGHVAWFGPAAIDSFEFFGVSDREPGALLERLPKKSDPGIPGELPRRFRASEFFPRFVTGRAEQLQAQSLSPWQPPPSRSALMRTLTLVGRNLVMKSRDAFFLLLTLVVPALVTALFVAVLGAETADTGRTPDTSRVVHHYFVVVTVMTCFFGALSASLEVVNEIPILRRERRGGLPILAYILSKAMTYAIPSVLFPAVALATLHGLAGDVMRGSLFDQWVVLVPTFFAAASAGLLLSSLLASAQGVIVVAVFYAIVQVVFSVFVPLHVTYATPARAQWLQVTSAPMTARWALGGLVTTTDLCDVRAVEATEGRTEQELQFEQTAFLQSCQTQMYQNHGIKDPSSSAQRIDREPRHQGLAANLGLAALALAAAGVALGRRSRGTQ
jgi:ABC-type multidrug transport system ATPase subunit/pSer/pThr/pTyr-binding forkhead associated (FHA) protein